MPAPETSMKPRVSRSTKVAAALEASIALWNLRARGLEDAGAKDRLCDMFVFAEGPTCGACPVRKRTGLQGCRGTPWVQWDKAKPGSARERLMAYAEARFLESLRAPGAVS